jgi:hypothetical protein
MSIVLISDILIDVFFSKKIPTYLPDFYFIVIAVLYCCINYFYFRYKNRYLDVLNKYGGTVYAINKTQMSIVISYIVFSLIILVSVGFIGVNIKHS